MANSPLLTMPILKMQEGVSECDSDYCHYPLCEDFVKEGILQFGGIFFSGHISGADGGAGFKIKLSPSGDQIGYRVGGRGNPPILGVPAAFANYNWSTELYPGGLHFPSCSSRVFSVNCASGFRPAVKGVGGAVSFNSFNLTTNFEWCSNLIVAPLRAMFRDRRNLRTLFEKGTGKALQTTAKNVFVCADNPGLLVMGENEKRKFRELCMQYISHISVGSFSCGGTGGGGRTSYYYDGGLIKSFPRVSAREILKMAVQYSIHFAIINQAGITTYGWLNGIGSSQNLHSVNNFTMFGWFPTIKFRGKYVLMYMPWYREACKYHLGTDFGYDFKEWARV